MKTKRLSSVLLILSFFIFMLLGFDESNKQESGTTSKDITHNVASIETSSGLQQINKSIPENWNKFTLENINFGLPKTWNRVEMRDEDGFPMTIFYDGEDLDNAPYGIIVQILDDYDSGLDYFESDPDSERLQINNIIIYAIFKSDEISVLMPRIGNSNRGLVFDFLANKGGGTDILKKILNTCSTGDRVPAVESTHSKLAVFNLSFSVPDTWDAARYVYGAEIQATAPAPTVTGYSPNIRLVASKLSDDKDLHSYWTINRDEVLEILPQVKMTDETTVTLDNGHETRRAVFTFVNQNSIPLAMYVCAFTYAGRGYTLTGLVPTEHADAYAPIFIDSFNSLNFKRASEN